MDIELFKNTYTPAMMRLVKKFAAKLELEIKEDLMCENHHVVLKAKHKIDDIEKKKMLIATYPACDICLEPNCESDHK